VVAPTPVSHLVFSLTILGQPAKSDYFRLNLIGPRSHQISFCDQQKCLGQGHTYTIPLDVSADGNLDYAYEKVGPSGDDIRPFASGKVSTASNQTVAHRYTYP
jgi:hypothetical protein